MKRFLLSLVVPFFSIVSCFAQGEVPVDMFTGTPTVQISLATVSDHDLSESVKIYYNAQGIKLQDQTNICGLGWQLQAGSVLSRVVRGLPDDYLGVSPDNRKGWLYNTVGTDVLNFGNTSDTLTTTCTDENTGASSDYSLLNGYNYTVDTEPDIFYYSVGQESGSFVFDNTGAIRLIPYRDVSIVPTMVSSSDKTILSFTITTNDGIKYTFNLRETITKTAAMMSGITTVDFLKRDFQYYTSALPAITMGSAWHITKQESPTGAVINYGYSSGVTVTSYDTITVGIRKLGTFALAAKPIYYITSTNQPYRIFNITSGTGEKVSFDISANLVNKVKVIDTRRSTLPFKTFTFAYKTTGTLSTNTLRTFLASLTESGGTCSTLPPYKFTYIGVDLVNAICRLPSIYSKSKDLWGYFNGKINKVIFPKIYVYPSYAQADRLRIAPLPTYTGSQYILDGADRTVDAKMIETGSLQTLSYPSGGSTTFSYEPHQYFDPVANQTLTGGGLRIKSIVYFDGVNGASTIFKNYTYTESNGNSSGRLIRRPLYALPAREYRDPDGGGAVQTYATLAAGSAQTMWESLIIRTDRDLARDDEGAIAYRHVKVARPGSGSSEYDFALSAVYGQGTNGDWVSTVNKFARPSTCPSMEIVSGSGKWSFPFSPNPNFAYDRGFILKKTDKNEAGVKVMETTYTPQYIYKTGSSAPAKVWALSYEEYPYSTTPIYFFGKYFWLTDVVKTGSIETSVVYDVADQTKTLTNVSQDFYESAAHRLLTKSKRTAADGTVYTTKIKYPLDFGTIPSNADTQLKCIGTLQANFRNGAPVESVSYIQVPGDVERVVGAGLIKYSDFGTTGKVLPYQQLSLKTDVGLTNFVDAAQTLQSSTYVLTNDSRYDVDQTFLSFDTYDLPLAVMGKDRLAKSTRYGYGKTFPVVQVMNAAYNEFAFSDFETDATTNATGSEFQLSQSIYGVGRTGLQAIHPKVVLTKTIQKAAVTNYVLSFWLKKLSASVDFQLNLKNVSTGAVFSTTTFTVSPVGTDFEYYEKVIPVTAVTQATFIAELQGLNFTGTYTSSPSLLPVLDDVSFYPQGARLAHYTYDIPFGVSSATDATNKTIFNTYDSLGRQRYVWDQDKNMLQKNTYKYTTVADVMTAKIIGAPQAVAGLVPIQFEANLDCIDGIKYEWDFGEGAGYETWARTATHTFSISGVKKIRLRKSHPLFPTVKDSVNLTVTLKSFDATICEKGTSSYSAANGALVTATCANITTMPADAEHPVFRVIANTAGESIQSYQWYRYDDYTQVWAPAGTGIESAISIMNSGVVHGDIHTFKIKCEMVTPTGHTGVSNELLISIYP